MASRSQSKRRPERENDSMEAVKPVIVLVLFGTILYGAYSVIQKGPSPDASPHANATEAPAFKAPQVDIPSPAVITAPSPGQAAAQAFGAAAVSGSLPASEPLAQAMAMPPSVPPQPATVVAAANPFGAEPAFADPPSVVPRANSPASLAPAEADAALAAAALGGVAAGATAAAIAMGPESPAWPPAAPPPAAVNEAAPTYLAAESAPPPGQDDVAVPSGTGEDRPQRLATLSTATIPPASLSPEMPPPAAAMPSSAAFATAWADAHEKLTAGRYAEALTALSVWYDDTSLGLEESHRLEDLLGQLAGTVIYSQQDLLLPPHVVGPGENLPAIASQLGVAWQLLAKINGVTDPMQLVPGEHLKLIRGPFDAVVSISRRRLSLQLGGAYAGSFPVVVGRQFLPRVGSSLPVAEIHRDAAAGQSLGQPLPAVAGNGRRVILLGDGVVIEGADEPALVADDAAAASLVVSNRDLDELLDILGPGSSVLIRQ